MATKPLFPAGELPADYSFVPDNGGLGVALVASGTASTPQKLPVGHSQSYLVTNDCLVPFWYVFCKSTGEATVACLPALPRSQFVGNFPNDASLTHISVITRSGDATGTINFGKGK